MATASLAFLLLALAQLGRVHWWPAGAVIPAVFETLSAGVVLAFILWDMRTRVDSAETVIPRMVLAVRHIAGALPANAPVVYFIALVPVLASYRLLEWLFSQSPPGAPLRESSA